MNKLIPKALLGWGRATWQWIISLCFCRKETGFITKGKDNSSVSYLFGTRSSVWIQSSALPVGSFMGQLNCEHIKWLVLKLGYRRLSFTFTVTGLPLGASDVILGPWPSQKQEWLYQHISTAGTAWLPMFLMPSLMLNNNIVQWELLPWGLVTEVFGTWWFHY